MAAIAKLFSTESKFRRDVYAPEGYDERTDASAEESKEIRRKNQDKREEREKIEEQGLEKKESGGGVGRKAARRRVKKAARARDKRDARGIGGGGGGQREKLVVVDDAARAAAALQKSRGEDERRQESSSSSSEEDEDENDDEDDDGSDVDEVAMETASDDEKDAEDENEDSDEEANGKEDEEKPRSVPREPEHLRLRRTVFVGNLPSPLSQRALKQVFETRCGKIESIRVRSLKMKPPPPPDERPARINNHNRFSRYTHNPNNEEAPSPAPVAAKQHHGGVIGKERRRAAFITGKGAAVEGARCNCYIVFKEERSVDIAVRELNMSVFCDRHIRVDRCVANDTRAAAFNSDTSGDGATAGNAQSAATAAATVLYDRRRSVFIGNLPFDVEDEEIYSLFADRSANGNGEESASQLLVDNGNLPRTCIGQLEAARVVRSGDTGVGKGFGFLLFKTREAATALLRAAERHERISRNAKAGVGKKASSKLPSSSSKGKAGAPSSSADIIPILMIRQRALRVTKVEKHHLASGDASGSGAAKMRTKKPKAATIVRKVTAKARAFEGSRAGTKRKKSTTSMGKPMTTSSSLIHKKRQKTGHHQSTPRSSTKSKAAGQLGKTKTKTKTKKKVQRIV